MIISDDLLSQIAKGFEQYKSGDAKSITFCVTEWCNLKCGYCYLVNLDKRKRLTKEQAKKNIDFVFDNPDLFQEEAVIWEFIGGEPFLEIELIDWMCDYIKIRMFESRPDWTTNHMYNFSTNGTLYHKPEVRRFIHKNLDHLSVGFSVDGCKEIHDRYRIYLDGRGSFDDVIRNIELYKDDFSTRFASTKATLSHESLPYIFESIKFLSSLDIIIYMNVVFEDAWQEGDDKVYYDQLIKVADWLIETGKWKTQYISLFDHAMMNASNANLNNKNWCGSGKMLHLSVDGKLYPCTRLAPYSMQYRKQGFSIGDIAAGYDQDKLDSFLNITKMDQSNNKCLSCKIESGCAWCTGWNYDKYGSIFKRATGICAMHLARKRANDYYFEKLEKLYGASSAPRQDQL